MEQPTHSAGWGYRIRTYTYGFRVRCPTIRRIPTTLKILANHIVPNKAENIRYKLINP